MAAAGGKVWWVDRSDVLEEAVEAILRCPFVAVDTEYDSLRRYKEKLCLIQMATKDAFYLFDPLSNLDLQPMGEIFYHAEILKIFHAGENDVRLLKRDYGFLVNNIFDTAKAASILKEERLSLTNLVKKYLTVEMEKKKSIQLSRWDARPLSEAQIAYAVEDVKYLFDLYVILERELTLNGGLGEAREAFEKINRVCWRERPFKLNGYKKIVKQENLTLLEKRKLKALYEWRHFMAVDLDLAPYLILTDRELLTVAREGIEALSKKKQRRWGGEIKRSVIYFKD